MLALLAGCIGPNLDVDPSVELGTGEVGFEPLNDGSTVPLVSGLQGGRHIWGAVRVIGIDWTEIDMTFSVEDDVGAPLTETTRVIQELQQCDTSTEGCESGMGEMVGVTILVNDEDATAVLGGNVVLRVEATDMEGRSSADSVIVDVTFSTE